IGIEMRKPADAVVLDDLRAGGSEGGRRAQQRRVRRPASQTAGDGKDPHCVLRSVETIEGRFTQADHGKQTRLKRRTKGDRADVYSPKADKKFTPWILRNRRGRSVCRRICREHSATRSRANPDICPRTHVNRTRKLWRNSLISHDARMAFGLP